MSTKQKTSCSRGKSVFSNKNPPKFRLHCMENHIFFFQTSWGDTLCKKIALEYDLSCIIEKNGLSISENMILPLGQIMKDDLSQKIHENIIFSSNVL